MKNFMAIKLSSEIGIAPNMKTRVDQDMNITTVQGQENLNKNKK